jgi:hypothetical protein
MRCIRPQYTAQGSKGPNCFDHSQTTLSCLPRVKVKANPETCRGLALPLLCIGT